MTSTFSFEIFPPKNKAAHDGLCQTIDDLAPCAPLFWSVTDGAGGGGADATVETAIGVKNRTGHDVAVHLTAINRCEADIADRLNELRMAGIRKIVALRGDLPQHEHANARAVGCSLKLIRQIALTRSFEISAACYPEPHPESQSAQADIDHLKRKQDAGADRLIGQFCFDTDTVLRYRDLLAKNGITIPFVPGIMPIKNFANINKFSKRCGATVPGWLEASFDGIDPKTPLHAMIAAGIAADQCRRLVAEGMGHLHVYCLNDALLTSALSRLLLAPDRPSLAA